MRRIALAIVIAALALALWIGGVQLDIAGGVQRIAAALPGASVASPVYHGGLPQLPGGRPSGAPLESDPVQAHAAQTRAAEVTVVIPRLRVHAPVYDRGVDRTGNLLIASGYALTHLRFSAGLGKWGNYVLYGHDDIHGNILRYLPTMRPGDDIELYQGSTRFVYEVVGSRIVAPTDVSVLDATDGATLTLLTCYPYMVDTQRIVVLAALVRVDEHVARRA